MTYKNILLSGLFTCILLFTPVFVGAASDGSYGLSTAATQAGLKETVAGQKDVVSLIGNIVSIALSFVAVGFFLLVLYAGFKWMFAAGNNEAITKAKGILEAAAIGLIIVLSAYAISSFVFRTIGEVAENTSNCEQLGGECSPKGQTACSAGKQAVSGGVCLDKSICCK